MFVEHLSKVSAIIKRIQPVRMIHKSLFIPFFPRWHMIIVWLEASNVLIIQCVRS